MRNLRLKPFVIILLMMSGPVWFGVAALRRLELNNLWSFMRLTPDVITADLAIIAIFWKWGWRLQCLQAWLVPFPDLNGTWGGQIQTNWKGADGNTVGPIPVILTIKQTFGRISCVMRTAEMKSHSYAEGFSLDPDRQIRQICYSYTSRPKACLRERSAPHDGTILFEIIGRPVRRLE